ncbi:HepT-like ribonuclease domain-containing protein [Curtobacterium sp. NPDC089689]|uniref:HepT-like ribonuclease domain-containing protein n=1 Tax=Curtobacterium sp. NPDC089689 TaxID=3363968 RepID=UPI003807CAAB
MTDRFRPAPRSEPEQRHERWSALQEAFLDLLAECSDIVEHGRPAFDAPRSLTYRAAEAVVIHFDDLVGRLPDDRAARLPEGLSLAAVRRTRNILSHDYRKAKKDIVWDVIEHRIPGVILAVLD